MEKVEESNEQHEESHTSPASSDKPHGEIRFVPVTQSPKKRRKVNHACVYCRRSHMTCDLVRPCTRCIKRNISHLCHDEPREPEQATTKKAKRQHSIPAAEETAPPQDEALQNLHGGVDRSPEVLRDPVQAATLSIGPSASSIIQPSLVSGIGANALYTNRKMLRSSDDTPGSQFQDMHNYHPSYMFNAPEVTNEYNLLNDFLNNSLLDDGALLVDDAPNPFADLATPNLAETTRLPSQQHVPTAGPSRNAQGPFVTRSANSLPTDKAREYYLQAADPSGNDAPEERMQRLLRAKYDAGMLKPFNYVNGYARLSKYMDAHMHGASKQKILRQLAQFRPKFREKVQALTDIELVYVEMWFERSLMEYDRVFASMAIPACCWRRTGEIFRGNKEMAELIHVPIENLRDGKIALHEVLSERSLVNYWEKFGAIAFDQTQKALLTSCSLKSPGQSSKEEAIKCCFSFIVRRDEHNIPSLIIGNFLPQDPIGR